MKRIVDIADLAVSSAAHETLITYALGPCLGVAAWDPVVRIGGLVHCQLPNSKSGQREAINVAQFVDTGVPALLDEMFALGAAKPRLIIKVAGGAQILDDLNLFQIAQKNYTVLRRLLWKNDLLIEAEDVGGIVPRTMSLHVGSGDVRIQSSGREYLLDRTTAPQSTAPVPGASRDMPAAPALAALTA